MWRYFHVLTISKRFKMLHRLMTDVPFPCSLFQFPRKIHHLFEAMQVEDLFFFGSLGCISWGCGITGDWGGDPVTLWWHGCTAFEAHANCFLGKIQVDYVLEPRWWAISTCKLYCLRYVRIIYTIIMHQMRFFLHLFVSWSGSNPGVYSAMSFWMLFG